MSSNIEREQLQHAEVECCLVDTGNWHERLSLRPLARPANSYALRIESRLDTAKDPHGIQIRYSATLDRDALLRLQDAVHTALGLAAG